MEVGLRYSAVTVQMPTELLPSHFVPVRVTSSNESFSTVSGAFGNCSVALSPQWRKQSFIRLSVFPQV